VVIPESTGGGSKMELRLLGTREAVRVAKSMLAGALEKQSVTAPPVIAPSRVDAPIAAAADAQVTISCAPA